MKKNILLILIFCIYALIICFSPAVTDTDIKIIADLQSRFHDLPAVIPLIMDSKLYALLIVLPLISGFMYFFERYLLIDLVLFTSSPLVAYIINIIIKNIIQRPRPPFELQLIIHPSSFSFVSSHTFVSTTLWGLAIFYINLYCRNRGLKVFMISLIVLWLISLGLSRILLGVHYPSDVIGGYFSGILLVYFYTRLIKIIGGKC